MNKPVPDEPPFREMSELHVFGPVAALTKIEMPSDIDVRYRAFFQTSGARASVDMCELKLELEA